MATFKPLSLKIRGANSDPRYASRLYLALVANNAMPGVAPVWLVRHRKRGVSEVSTVSLLDEVRNKVCFVGMVESCYTEFELVRELESVSG